MTEDQDPTGMRHLLASLKESGPMPADLNKRITESLADEEAARQAPSDTADVDGDGGGLTGGIRGGRHGGGGTDLDRGVLDRHVVAAGA